MILLPTDLEITVPDSFAAISSNGKYCVTVRAVDDSIVESLERFRIIVEQDGQEASEVNEVEVTDNDCTFKGQTFCMLYHSNMSTVMLIFLHSRCHCVLHCHRGNHPGG